MYGKRGDDIVGMSRVFYCIESVMKEFVLFPLLFLTMMRFNVWEDTHRHYRLEDLEENLK